MHAKWVACPGGGSQTDLKKRMRAQWNVPMQNMQLDEPSDDLADLDLESTGDASPPALAITNGEEV